jgi:hypothetical protein
MSPLSFNILKYLCFAAKKWFYFLYIFSLYIHYIFSLYIFFIYFLYIFSFCSTVALLNAHFFEEMRELERIFEFGNMSLPIFI